MAERLVKNITEDYLTCTICWDIYSDPKMLQCGHTFCSRCLQDYVESVKRSKDVIECPICRHSYEIESTTDPKEWITALNPDKVSLSILKAIGVKQPSHIQMGELSENMDAPEIEGNDAENVKYACARHRGKNLDVYCSGHDVVVCSECAWREHREPACECSSADEVIGKRLGALKCLVAQQSSDAENLMESNDANAKTAKSVLDDFMKSITEVEESFVEMYILFNQKIRSVRKKAKETLDKDLTICEIKGLQERLSEKLKALDTLTDEKDPNESMNDISELCRESSQLQINIQHLSEKIKSGSLMKYAECDLNVLDAFVSSTKQNIPDAFLTYDEIFKDEPNDAEYVMITRSGQFLDTPETDDHSVNNYKQFTFSTQRPDETKCMLSSVAIIGTTSIVTVDQINKKLKKFKIPEGHFLCELKFPFEPHQVSTLRGTSNLAVTVWDEPKVLIVETDPVLAILKTVETDKEYIGVTSHIEDSIAVASVHCRRVDTINLSGSLPPIVKGKTLYQSSRRRSFPDRLASTRQGNIVIRNRVRREIMCFNHQNNELLWSRRLKTSVSDVACFRDRVFASLRDNDEIVCFRQDGQGELQYLRPETFIKKPWALSGFKDCLVVTEDSPSDLVHVFVFFSN